MLTRRWRNEWLEGRRWFRREPSGIRDRLCLSLSLSLRLRDAPIGALALISMALGILIVSVLASFNREGLGAKGISVSRALAIIIFLFAPAILSAVYSLFFEQSKVYGSFGLLVAGLVMLAHSLTWYWFAIYLPFVFVFTVFCAMVRLLEHRAKR